VQVEIDVILRVPAKLGPDARRSDLDLLLAGVVLTVEVELALDQLVSSQR
jgi:hypothetical protein